jgi:hypothetical protein
MRQSDQWRGLRTVDQQRLTRQQKKLERAKAVVETHDYSKIFGDELDSIREPRFLNSVSKGKNLKSEFAFIRQLIKRKEYNEARYRLLKINHPKADEWLDKLNHLDPNYTETTTLLLKPLFLMFVVIILFMSLLYGMNQVTVETALFVGFLLGIVSLVLLSLWSRQV